MAITSILNSILKNSEPFQNNNGGNNNGSNNGSNNGGNNVSNNGSKNGSNNVNNGQQSTNYGQMMILLIIVILWLCLVLLVGKHLWNECLCKVVTICKPMDSVFSLLGVIVLLDILNPNM